MDRRHAEQLKREYRTGYYNGASQIEWKTTFFPSTFLAPLFPIQQPQMIVKLNNGYLQPSQPQTGVTHQTTCNVTSMQHQIGRLVSHAKWEPTTDGPQSGISRQVLRCRNSSGRKDTRKPKWDETGNFKYVVKLKSAKLEHATGARSGSIYHELNGGNIESQPY